MNVFNLKLAASALVIGGTVLATAAFAQSGGNVRGVTVLELEDGALVVARANGETPALVRYLQTPGLAASRCLKIQGIHQSPNEMAPHLVNGCDYAVVVAYCIDSPNGETADRCELIDRRIVVGQKLPPGGALSVVAGAVDSHVDGRVAWVACRAGSGVVSSLTRNGTRGACLKADGASMSKVSMTLAPSFPVAAAAVCRH